MLPGKVSASDIRKALGMSPKAWEKLTVKLRDAGSELSKALEAVSVRYAVMGNGKRLRAYLVR